MDAFEHINNTVYFRYFEDVRIEYFKKINVLEYMNKGLVVYYDYRQGQSCNIPDAILSAINDLQSHYG